MRRTTNCLALTVTIALMLTTAIGCSSKTNTPSSSSQSPSGTAVSTESGLSTASSGGSSSAVSTASASTSSKLTASQATAKQKQVISTLDKKTQQELAKIPSLKRVENPDNINLKGATVNIGTWVGYQPGQGTNEDQKRAAALNALIEKTYNCKLAFPSGIGDPAFKTSILSGKPKVDMFALQGVNNFYDYYSAGCLAPMESFKYVQMNDTTKFRVPSLTEFGGKHYGLLPVLGNWYTNCWCNILLCNFDLTAQAGYTADKIYGWQNSGQWDWAHFEMVCNAVSKISGKYGFDDIGPEDKQCYGVDTKMMMYQAMLDSEGTDWISKNNGKLSFSGGSTLAMKVLNQYAKWADPNTGFIKFKDATSSVSQPSWTDFQNGVCAFVPTVFVTPIICYGFTTTHKSGALYFPKGPDNTSGYVAPQWTQTYVCIAKGVSNPQAIGAIFNAINTPIFTAAEQRQQCYQSVAGPAQLQSSVDTMMKIYDDIKTPFATNAAYGIAANIGWTGNSSKPGWYDYVYKVAQGQMTANQAVSEFTARGNSVLNSFYQ